MRTLAGWYPGDGVVFAALEVLGMITLLSALTWAAAQFPAPRRPALRAALWLSALLGVLLTPAFALIGRQLPWRVAVLSHPDAGPAQPGERASRAAPAVPVFLPSAPPGAEVGPPTGAAGTPRSRAAAPPAGAPGGAAPRTEVPASGAPPSRAAEGSPALLDEPPAPRPSPLRALALLALLVWGLGSVYLGARLLYGSWRVRRLWPRLRPLDAVRWAAELKEAARILAVARLPEICLSPDVRSPLVAGLFPPRVVLPDALPERSTSAQVLAVLVHECAHIVRRDPWVRLLQRLAAALYWVHPLVHLLNRRLDRAREEVCDNHVLGYADAPTYAETLLTVAQLCYPLPHQEGYLTMMPLHYNLERRVADLLEERRDKATRLPTPQRVGLLTSLVLLLVAASSVGLHGAAQARGGKGAGAPATQAPAKAQAPPVAGAKLTGVIHAADGKLAAGAIVWAAQFDYGPLKRRETVAGADGRFALDLAPGRWWLWARRGTQGGEGQSRSGTITIAAGQAPPPVAIRLGERGTFRGRLLEAETGKPIPGGQLVLDAGLTLTADNAGRFEMGGLSRDNHEAFVVAPGRMRMRVLFDTTARADTELDVPVPRGGKIVGRVTDLDGKPIPGAHVGRHTSGSFFSINGLFLACDAEGRFAYDDAVPPGQPTRLSAAAPGYVEEDRAGVQDSPEGKPLVLNFRLRPKPGTPAAVGVPDPEKRRVVSGFVHGPDAKPVAGAVVRWGHEPNAGAIQTKTDAAGRFRLVVPDKANVLAVLPRAFQPQFPRVAAGGDREVAVKLRPGRSARGRVHDDTGKPIENVHVIAVVQCPDPAFCNPYWLVESAVYTDAEGKFELQGVPDGARFDFLKPGLSDVRNHPLDLARADNTVTLLYGGAVSGRVLDQGGKPIRNFRVLVNFPRAKRAGDASVGFFAGYCGIGVRFTSADGNFVLTGVGAGSVYRIMALADGHGEAVADRVVAVPVNRLKDVKPAMLRAGPPVRLRVHAVTAAGKPIQGARVTLVNGEPELDKSFLWGYHDASWEDMVRGRTAADGWADFPALSFGGATVLVQAPGFARQRVGWRNGNPELTCALPREAVLAGEVLDAAAKPVKAFHVRLTRDGEQLSAGSDAAEKGRFRLAELPAGKWQVTVLSDDGRAVLHQGEVTLKAGETRELKIETKKE